MNNNKSYRINTKIGQNSEDINLNLNILQEYDILEILSLKINSENFYKMHTSNYGCVVGRVLANGGVGVPNAKIAMFIEVNNDTVADEILYSLYPYKTTTTKNENNIRYNLLPIEQVSDCHQPIGTFPNKRLVLDDKNVLEIFDKYYKYTTVTNESGDYMIFGVPVGNQTFHMDIDLSDIGFLSQKPIDMIYKGYPSTMFNNSMQFKSDENIDNLVQVISQNNTVYVKPFWGEENSEEIGITRNDIDVNYKFEPTCIFLGSLISDEKSNGFSKKCIPMQNMGRMERLTTGSGTIEMIRKRMDGSVEEFPINGNELIDGNGTWCYQIPMNLDYVTTDEYGNLVPTDNPEKGIPTRARVRFRASLSDFDSELVNSHLVKVLIPHNPKNMSNIDYSFGSATNDSDDDGTNSFRDLLWNNVYTVKSYIPRIQKGNNQRTTKFSGIKAVNVNGSNNPIPYNNMRVNITFMFILQCAIIKTILFFIRVYNTFMYITPGIGDWSRKNRKCAFIGDGLCPDLDGWYFSPGCDPNNEFDQMGNTLKSFTNISSLPGVPESWLNAINNANELDTKSIENENKDDDQKICLTKNIDYFMQCIEINLALENNVIQFDFYNDWINGLIYIPRWFADIKKKRSYLFNLIKIDASINACMADPGIFDKKRHLTQQCALGYSKNNEGLYTNVGSPDGCHKGLQNCHRYAGRKNKEIFGENGGLIYKQENMNGKNIFYLKPCEFYTKRKANFFATDIVLLGNINKCNIYGIPSEFEGLISSSYQMPPALVQTNMDSDGVLYGLKGGNGQSRCTDNVIHKGVEQLEQTFENYDTWSNQQDPNKEKLHTTEYAVSEMSGIDWGVGGPNQGKSYGLYKPGGHFLGIACSNAQVNIKSCVNLSRICEIGVMMSQRQAIPYYDENEKKILYKYIIPSGFISKDETEDNNFRNIFASLNYNKLKTMKNDNGIREYVFIPLQPINFNGDLNKRVSNVKYNEFRYDNNNDKSKFYNASAYTRTIEEYSKDYCYFRFGINENSNHTDYFLRKIDNLWYMPVYENSYYFYFGSKNGSTALDRFLRDYYATCPKIQYSNTPDFSINIENPTICGVNDGKMEIQVVNVTDEYKCIIENNDGEIKHEETYNVLSFPVRHLSEGAYKVSIISDKQNFKINKTVVLVKGLPTDTNSNFYENCWTLETVNYIEEPNIVYTDDKITSTPEINGGVLKITLPKQDYEKELQIKGIGIVSGEFCMYESFDGETTISFKDRFESEFGHDYKYVNYKLLKKIDNKESLNNVNDGCINYYIDESKQNVTYSLKLWGSDITYDVYIFYGCSGDLGLYYIDSIKPTVDSQRFTYYLFDESVKIKHLSEVLSSVGEYASINYEGLHEIDNPFYEWAVKKALYYTSSFYNGGSGKINVGVLGGTPPYRKVIIGDEEVVEDEKITLKPGKVSDISFFSIPTKPWINELFIKPLNDIRKKSFYYYMEYDEKNHVPYIIKNNETNK